jgi:mannose-6-phosphate isomerase class I
MQIVEKKNATIINPTSSTQISEFPTDNPTVSGAIADINGRYPESGFVQNKTSKELVYVIKGNGIIITKNGQTEFHEGDVLFVDKNEPFAWEGNFSIFMATSPKFDPKQHKLITIKK